MKVPVEIRKVDLGQHPGCRKVGYLCYSASGAEESNGISCSEHCQVYDSCGLSWEGGTEFFGFNNGPSVNCQERLEAELGAGEGNFDGRILDEIFDHEESLRYYRGEIPEEVSHYDPFPEKIGLKC